MEFTPGQHVQSHPATDTWMRGDRYGTVEKVGLTRIHVRMDRSGLLRRFAPTDLLDRS